MSQPVVRFVHLPDLPQAVAEFKRVDADVRSWEIMAPKAIFKVVKISDLSSPAANILKQEMLSLGAEAAVARGVITARSKRSAVLLMGTVAQLERLTQKIRSQPFGLNPVSEELLRLLSDERVPVRRPLRCRNLILPLGRRPYVMGVLNVTPDSFSDGGQYDALERAVPRAHQMVEQGADIIDVGGESTRPGARRVPLREELRRVIPVVERLCSHLKVPISVDTYKAEVARQALRAGAHMINDISALRFDRRLAQTVADSGAALILMHMKGSPRSMQRAPGYDDVMAEVFAFLAGQVRRAEGAGISRERLVVDPGIGFGKRVEDNLAILNRLGELLSLGLPLLVGVSRKSFIGKVLDLPVEDRLEGTSAAVAMAVARGAHIVRVHDVKQMVRVARMTQAISQTWG
jgi:dihydropteroate synthase